METMLAFEAVSAGYGRTNVLNGLTFEVRRGEVLGVIGPNGSGKTTMFNALTGIIRLNAGKIVMEGQDISRLSVDARSRRGIRRTFQIPRPFSRMTVFENVLVACAFGAGVSERASVDPTNDVLRVCGLTDKRDAPAGSLTLIDRKRLEIARAIVSRPKLLLLDEAAAGLSSAEVHEVVEIVEWLRSAGFTVIWIEHIIETILTATDRLMCMAEGSCAVVGDPREVLASDEVERLYLGTSGKAGDRA